mgnify:CR=1 FL=1
MLSQNADADLLELFLWDEDTFLARTEGSAIRRIGFERWLRNLAVGLGNGPESLDWNGDISPTPNDIGFDYAFIMAATGDRDIAVIPEGPYVVPFHAAA